MTKFQYALFFVLAALVIALMILVQLNRYEVYTLEPSRYEEGYVVRLDRLTGDVQWSQLGQPSKRLLDDP